MALENGSRVAVIGGGPSGSLAGYFLLEMADRAGIELQVDIYEPRDFSRPGPAGCNHCGGIVSESLVQMLAMEGINLPANVVQRGLDSYILHTDDDHIQIGTPFDEKRIAALFRGSGPKGSTFKEWESFDDYLLKIACEKGANHVMRVVREISWESGRPVVKAPPEPESSYDLLVSAVGINSSGLKVLRDSGVGFEGPVTTKTFISEIFLGADRIKEVFGSAMHVFLLDIPRLEFAALIPKGGYVTACMLGHDLDKETVARFFDHPEVRGCLPPDVTVDNLACECLPKINIAPAKLCYSDRLVMVGDCGVSRLYKDGIGAAYRTAKACAITAVFQGVSKESFRRFYEPACRRMKRDNRIGKIMFSGGAALRRLRFLRHAMLAKIRHEQCGSAGDQVMSSIVWDLFTGSAPYRDILLRGLRPGFILSFAGYCLSSLLRGTNGDSRCL